MSMISHRDITNIRYAELGKIAFDYKGIEIKITEPMDVLLVGTDRDEIAAIWIRDKYQYLLQYIGKN